MSAPVMTRRGNSNADVVVKFPIGRVVREHRISYLTGDTEWEAIERALISMRRATITLRRQQATLTLLEAQARKKRTPEQRARIAERHMQHIYARMAEDEANEAVDGHDGGSAA
jgi:hypothetical protein